jgi:hypothetical protein
MNGSSIPFGSVPITVTGVPYHILKYKNPGTSEEILLKARWFLSFQIST